MDESEHGHIRAINANHFWALRPEFRQPLANTIGCSIMPNDDSVVFIDQLKRLDRVILNLSIAVTSIDKNQVIGGLVDRRKLQ